MSAPAKHTPGPWHGDEWGGIWSKQQASPVAMDVSANDRPLIVAAPALLAALVEAVNYIEHSTANRGKLSNAEQWDANVREFRATVGELSIGRTAVPCATVNLTAARAAIAAAKGAA
jgi:hypothetical protein